MKVAADARGPKFPRKPFTFHAMSTSKAKAKAATNVPLSLEDTLHDMAVIRSSDIDLAAILASAIPAPSPVSPARTGTWTAADVDASVARSHEFAQAARAAINDLYRHEFRLMMNLFQPSVKLQRKTRVGARRVVQ